MSIEEPRVSVSPPRHTTGPGASPRPGVPRPELFSGRRGPVNPSSSPAPGWAANHGPVPGYPATAGHRPGPAPTAPWASPEPRAGGGAPAVAALILGGLGVGLGWVPVISFLVVLLALGALVCAVIALTRSAAPRPRTTQAALVVAVAALIVSLLGSVVSVSLIADRLEARRQLTTPVDAPVAPTAPRSTSPTPAASPGAVPSGVTNYGPGPERIYLTVVRGTGVVVTDERAAIDLGYGVCTSIARGVPRQQIYQEVADTSGLPPSKAAGVSGAAIGSFCPSR